MIVDDITGRTRENDAGDKANNDLGVVGLTLGSRNSRRHDDQSFVLSDDGSN
jgi:hypothetical protein